MVNTTETIKYTERFVYIFLAFTFFVHTCEKGLDRVEGIEGNIHIPSDSTAEKVMWPDSLEGAVVVVAEYQLYSSIDSFFSNLVAYSDPIDTSNSSQEYFIQTLPGIYIAGIVGVKIPIADIFFLPKDSLAAHPEYFIPLSIYGLPDYELPQWIEVEDDKIINQIDMTIDYGLELPF